MPADVHILHQQAWKNLSKRGQNPKTEGGAGLVKQRVVRQIYRMI